MWFDQDQGDQAEVRRLTREIIRRCSPPERVAELDRAHEFDHRLYVALGEAGLVGLDAEATSGRDADPALQTAVLEEVAAGPTSMAVCLVVQYMVIKLLASFGTDAQRQEVLAPLLRGERTAAFGLTESEAGTDIARAMRTTARPLAEGWVIRGEKSWISGARVAEHLLLLARTSDPAPSAIDGVSMFVVPLDTPGITVREIDTLGIHGLDTSVIALDEVRASGAALVGREGAGFRQVLETLNGERLNAAAVALGIARSATEVAIEHGLQRRAFGRPVGGFQALQHSLVDCSVRVESAAGLLRRAEQAPLGTRAARILSSMAKLACAEAAHASVKEGLRILAAGAFSTDHPMQRLFRDAQLYTFAPLTNDMIRNNLGEAWLGLPRSY